MNANDRHSLVAVALLGMSHSRRRALRDRVHGDDGGFALSASDVWPDRRAARGCGPISGAGQGAAALLLLSVRCCAPKRRWKAGFDLTDPHEHVRLARTPKDIVCSINASDQCVELLLDRSRSEA
jgi:hypothetical protein